MTEPATGDLTRVLLQPGCDVGRYAAEYLEPIENMDFPAYYLAVLAQKGVTRGQAAARSGLEIHYAYQIFSGIRRPKRDKILCLCIGGGFSLRETERALERAAAGGLYAKRLRDALIMLALHRGIHTVWQVNELLAEQGQALLG